MDGKKRTKPESGARKPELGQPITLLCRVYGWTPEHVTRSLTVFAFGYWLDAALTYNKRKWLMDARAINLGVNGNAKAFREAERNMGVRKAAGRSGEKNRTAFNMLMALKATTGNGAR